MRIAKFELEQAHVERLTAALSLPACSLQNPHAGNVVETGIDVVVRCGAQRYGVQVTVPGDRAEEARAASVALAGGEASFMWLDANSASAYKKFAKAIARKAEIAARHDFSAYDETWLLMIAGAPEYPGIMSTQLPPWFDANDLTKWTRKPLAQVKYDRVFLHSIVDVKPRLLMWTHTDLKWIDLTSLRPAPEQ